MRTAPDPRAIIGGNVVSGLIGLIVGARVGDPLIGCGVAVGLAIMAMALLKCLHPSGGGLLGDAPDQLAARAGVGEVQRQYLGRHRELPREFVGDRAEAVGPPRHQHGAVSQSAQTARDLGPDTGGSAGDDDRTGSGRFGQTHSAADPMRGA